MYYFTVVSIFFEEVVLLRTVRTIHNNPIPPTSRRMVVTFNCSKCTSPLYNTPIHSFSCFLGCDGGRQDIMIYIDFLISMMQPHHCHTV
mmetsp:Transcript_6496/g.6395  ORF Transcript_6496/g.6395 Transcript_6496/m.6395 type:complete len:89 (-) Transcript_6496:178-444(-)